MKKSYLWAIMIISITIILTVFVWSSGTDKAAKVPAVYGYGLFQPEAVDYPSRPGHVYLITVDRLALQDLAGHPDLFNEITGQAALGLMSVGVEGGLTADNTYTSIGAGAPVNASDTGAHGLNNHELLQGIPAGEIFRQRTGLIAQADAVLQLDIARIKKINEANRYSAVPGLLGTLLQEQRVAVSVLGSADSNGKTARPVVALAMNKDGIVNSGDVSDNLLVYDPSFPGGMRTDYDKLLPLLLERHRHPGLTVVELGDLERLEVQGKFLEESVLQIKRREALAGVANLLTQLLGQMEREKDLLLLVSPTPRGEYLPDTNYVTPVLAAGCSITPGLLTSPTTKRPGIVRNTDLAPTILAYYQLNAPAQMYGRPLQVISTDQSLARLTSLYGQLELIYQSRSPVLHNYVLVLLILVLLSLAAIFLPHNKVLVQLLKPMLLAIMAVPVSLLMVTLLPHDSLVVLVLEIVTLTIGITAAISLRMVRHTNVWEPFIIISLFTSLCILIDLFCGAPLQKQSLLGYDPIAGARFYGIGNEYMGVLLGSTIIGITALITRFTTCSRKAILAGTGLYFIITLYAIAAPEYGTNVGGSLAGAFALLVTFLLLARVKFNFQTILKTVGSVGILLLLLIIYDLQRPLESQSHIGRTANLILQSGPVEMLNIIHRKLSMNIKLIKYTIWSRVFLASLASLVILFYRPIGVIQRIFSHYTDMYIGFIGVTTASIMALIFNDSGVVAAATAMIFGAPPLLYLVIRSLHSEIPAQK
ncbi:hypothetical protein SPSYN_01496 [Sporotomaculum syntrophicum]|uniref:Uncharacterized protein n=1 Tax=Sporotomaculum syntrophicum TaxID=182264 RepID=A0A9D3AWF5_9FIRM|nr:hypothetical protein [Sporotomaculum syntrophicum]KAF1085360.1 hypothetical protein SPSYN_01496 [Sporotomaculum syntrophicum]